MTLPDNCSAGAMIKSELALRIAAKNPHLEKGEITRVVNTIFGRISNALVDGDRVELRGLGVFLLVSVRRHIE